MTSLTSDQLDDVRAKALGDFLKKASKDHGTRITTLSDNRSVDVDVIPTGALSLDYALGVGGLPRGRITEIYGPTGGGKTTLTLEAAVNCQRDGGVIGFVDAEQALNRELTDSIGIDSDRFVIAQPDTGEQAIEIARDMVESDAFDMVIVDSAAALVPKAEIDADVEQQFMGLQARLLSRFMRVITGPVAQHNVAFVVINQVRSNLQSYGAPEESTGGKALKFYSTTRVEVRTSAGKQIKKGADVIGTTVVATVKKNKLASPFKKAEYDIMFGQGIEAANGLVQVAVNTGVVVREGNTYKAKLLGADLRQVDEKLGVGIEKSKDMLRENSELFDDIEAAVKAVMAGRKVQEDVPVAQQGQDEAPPTVPQPGAQYRESGNLPSYDPAAATVDTSDEDMFGLNG